MWVELPERLPVDTLFEKCMSHGVGVVKSRAFAADQEHPGNAVRLNFTYATEEDIRKAAEIFGEMTR